MLIRRLLVPVDLSDRSRPLLDYAFQLAELIQANVDVVHVVPGPGMAHAALDAYAGLPMPRPSPHDLSAAYQNLGDLVDRCRCRGAVPRLLVEAGDVASAIVRVAAEAPSDLIVLATRGHRGVAELLLGSVAHAVIASAGCPVVTLGEPALRGVR
jgi:nucleotide-binding universal stress UspA family protein